MKCLLHAVLKDSNIVFGVWGWQNIYQLSNLLKKIESKEKEKLSLLR